MSVTGSSSLHIIIQSVDIRSKVPGNCVKSVRASTQAWLHKISAGTKGPSTDETGMSMSPRYCMESVRASSRSWMHKIHTATEGPRKRAAGEASQAKRVHWTQDWGDMARGGGTGAKRVPGTGSRERGSALIKSNHLNRASREEGVLTF
jgi:hypothetical protein